MHQSDKGEMQGYLSSPDFQGHTKCNDNPSITICDYVAERIPSVEWSINSPKSKRTD